VRFLVLAALGFICATLLAQSFEFVERLWAGQSQRQASHIAAAAGPHAFISIHLACANEPPDMPRELPDEPARPEKSKAMGVATQVTFYLSQIGPRWPEREKAFKHVIEYCKKQIRSK
jgi:hypothetical protein